MAGFGSFMEGLQGGIGTGQDIRRKRQLDEIYDQEVTLGREKASGRDFSRARAGLPALKKFSSGDPVLFRMIDAMKRGSNATESPTASALPVAGEMETAPVSLSGDYGIEMPEQDFSGVEAPDYEFARGTPGGVDDAMRRADELSLEEDGPKQRRGYSADSKEEIARRTPPKSASRAGVAEAPARQAIPTQVVDRSGDKTLGQKVAGKAKAAAKYEGVGMPSKAGAGLLRRGAGALGRAAAIGGIAGAAAGGMRGAQEGGGDYVDPQHRGDPLIDTLYDVKGRAISAGKGIVSGVLDPLGAIMGSDEEAPVEQAPAEAIPTAGGGGPRRGSTGPGKKAAMAPAAPGAVPTAPAAEKPDDLAGFDISKVSAEEIPNFSNKDWESFREENVQELVANGMSYAEAWDKVDQQTINTQRRGFLHFASQADALLANGDKRGAAAAVRAAFQYMPSTTDLKVGEYNGHVVAFGVDEESGEQVGTPKVITPELLQRVQMNFASPQVWAEYAQDRRKLDQADRELGQGDRRLDLLEKGVGIERENAMTNRIKAIGGAGGEDGVAGMKLSDADRHTQFWQDQSFAAAGDDTELQAAMAAVMASLYTEDGGATRPEVIARQVTGLAKTEEGRAKILAAANQFAGG